MAQAATATIAATATSGGFSYSITLNDTGTTPIGTFWFAWIPGEDFLKTAPMSAADPIGWSHQVTGGGAANGFAILWQAGPGSAVQPGGTLGFSFTSADTPAEVFGNSVFYPTTSVLVSFVYSGAPFSDAGTRFAVAVACFAEGTRLATAEGESEVELLVPGTPVRVRDGRIAPVKWTGHRRVDCRRAPRPRDVWPVRVAAHAFAPGQPARPLWLSPDHAVLIDGVLIPVRYLVNGATIVQEPRDAVTYWHVELDRHDVLLAEGLPCESYLDTGNRGAFANGGPPLQLHPDFALRVWQAEACARLAVAGAELEAARSWLLARAGQLGHLATDEPALRLCVGAQVLWPRVQDGWWCFDLPASACHARLLSRSAVPAEMWADGADPRRLGVAVSQIVLGDREIVLADACRGDGWHPAERGDAGATWRWTDGNADLVLPGGGGVLAVRLVITGRYWCDAEAIDRGAGTAASRVTVADMLTSRAGPGG